MYIINNAILWVSAKDDYDKLFPFYPQKKERKILGDSYN